MTKIQKKELVVSESFLKVAQKFWQNFYMNIYTKKRARPRVITCLIESIYSYGGIQKRILEYLFLFSNVFAWDIQKHKLVVLQNFPKLVKSFCKFIRMPEHRPQRRQGHVLSHEFGWKTCRNLLYFWVSQSQRWSKISLKIYTDAWTQATKRTVLSMNLVAGHSKTGTCFISEFLKVGQKFL